MNDIGLFGDKTEARRIAIENKVPVAAGSGPLKNAQDAIWKALLRQQASQQHARE